MYFASYPLDGGGGFDCRSDRRIFSRNRAEISRSLVLEAFRNRGVRIFHLLMLRLALPFFGAFAAVSCSFDVLPEAVAEMIQADALHLFKFQHSPSAPISNLTETNDYFPTLEFRHIDHEDQKAFYMYLPYLDPNAIQYTIPSGRYLSLYEIQERTQFRSVNLAFQSIEGNCDALGIYYFDGGDNQVLRADDSTRGMPSTEVQGEGIEYMGESDEDQPGLVYGFMYELHDLPRELYGRQVMLYIPSECTLRLEHVVVRENLPAGATEETLEATRRTFN